MIKYAYQITMQTALGLRHGTMLLEIQEHNIEGYMSILARKNYLSGEIDEKGDCRIRGTIATLIRTFEYSATGHLDKDWIEFTLIGVRNTYKIKGIACEINDAI